MANRRPNMPRVRPAGHGVDGSGAAARDAGIDVGNDAEARPAAGARPTAGSRPTTGGDLPVNRAKVVPLGSVPGEAGGQEQRAQEQETHRHAPDAAHAPASAPKPGARSIGKPRPGTRRPATPRSAMRRSATRDAPERHDSAHATPDANDSAAGSSAPAAPATGPARPARPKRGKAGPSEKRLRERAVLSGGIRSAVGPAQAGHGRRPEPDHDAAPVPARAFSGRMLALAVILVVITILLLPSVGTYMNQRTELAQLENSIAQKQTQQAELKEQIARWDDPAYIKAQARDRINLVMPGERKYMVIGSATGEDAPASESPGAVRTDLPWVDALWDTIKRSATD